MKSLEALFLGVLFAATTCLAEDITLIDGRTYHDARVLSQTAVKVTIKHAEGLVSVGKEILPPELRAKYPVDERAYQAEEQRAEAARKAAREQEKADSERIARDTKRREAAAAASQAGEERSQSAEDALYAAVEADAQRLAKNYFTYEYRPANSSATSWDTSVLITEIRPVEGWAGRWFVRGRANIKFYQSQGRTFTTESRNFEAYYAKAGRKVSFEMELR